MGVTVMLQGSHYAIAPTTVKMALVNSIGERVISRH